MEWLRRHAWQLLFGMTALIAFIGLNPVKAGYPRGSEHPARLYRDDR